MSSYIKWESNDLGEIAHIGDYTLFIFSHAIIDTSHTVSWMIFDGLFSFENVSYDNALASGKEKDSLAMTLIRRPHDRYMAINRAKRKAEQALFDLYSEEIEKWLTE